MRPADYSAFARAAVDAGYDFEFRYLCLLGERALNDHKIARPNEVAAARAAGLDVALIWQDTKHDALGGYTLGKAHGNEARRQASVLGYPIGATIYFAVGDYDAPTSAHPVIAEYLRGVGEELVMQYHVGGYGKRSVVEDMKARGLIRHIWQSYGFSRPIGEISPSADVYQRREQVDIAGIKCDVNESFRPFGAWEAGQAMDIISRAEWGALKAKAVARVDPSRRTHFMVHYSTGEELGRDDSFEWVREIQRFHMSRYRGWSDIAYNFLVDRYGRIFEGRGWDVIGSHCEAFNSPAIGVCFLGDDDPGQDAPEAARAAIRWLADEADRHTGKRLTRWGHRDKKSTGCPGDELYNWVHAGMPLVGGPSTPTPPATKEYDDMHPFDKTPEDAARGIIRGLCDDHWGKGKMTANDQNWLLGIWQKDGREAMMIALTDHAKNA